MSEAKYIIQTPFYTSWEDIADYPIDEYQDAKQAALSKLIDMKTDGKVCRLILREVTERVIA